MSAQQVASENALQVRVYPGPLSSSADLVLFHGWGLHSGFWQGLVSELQHYFNVHTIDFPGFGDNVGCHCSYKLEELLQLLEPVLPEQAIYLGWSMGGEIALAFADQYPGRVRGIINISSNPCFVVKDNWPSAMAREEYEAFESGVEENCRVTLKRFLALMAKGCREEKPLLALMRKVFLERNAASRQVLMDSLGLLAALDLRSLISEVKKPMLWIGGSNDALVPVEIAGELKNLSNEMTTVVIDDASHAVFLSHQQEVLDCLFDFFRQQCWLENSAAHIEKKQIAESFSRAATSYDGVAQLQRRIGENLLEKLPVTNSSACVIDLGCGTGFFSKALAKRFVSNKILSIDLAEGMLSYAKDQYASVADWVGGDAESLPVADEKASLLFSSLAIQWSEAPQLIFEEARRVLEVDGVFAFATLGSGTLKELRGAWQKVDNYVHVNHFIDVADLEETIIESGLNIELLEQQTVVLEYDELKDLTRELKALGAHNLNQGRPKGLTGRERVNALKAAYEDCRSDSGSLPATYDVIYGVLRK